MVESARLQQELEGHSNLNNLNYGVKTATSDPVYLGCHVAVAAKTSVS